MCYCLAELLINNHPIAHRLYAISARHLLRLKIWLECKNSSLLSNCEPDVSLLLGIEPFQPKPQLCPFTLNAIVFSLHIRLRKNIAWWSKRSKHEICFFYQYWLCWALYHSTTVGLIPASEYSIQANLPSTFNIGKLHFCDHEILLRLTYCLVFRSKFLSWYNIFKI